MTLLNRPNTVAEERSTPKFDPNVIASEVTDEKTTLLEAEGGSLHSRPGQGIPFHSYNSFYSCM